MTHDLSRRGVVGSGLFVSGLLGATAAAGEGEYDPRKTADGQIKLTATLDGSPAFWTYSGVIYAVQPQRHPEAILALTGCQSTWARRGDDGGFRISGAVLTFFRDPQTGAFLEAFDNPLTGRRNSVTANVLTGGGILYPPDGSSARAEGRFKASAIAPGGYRASDPERPLGAVRWVLDRSCVTLMTDRSWNVPVQPQLEAQSQTGDRAMFFDRRVQRMPARFAATTIMPWLRWMDMSDAPGHLVWHSSGEKLFALGDLPQDFRAHAGARLAVLATPPPA